MKLPKPPAFLDLLANTPLSEVYPYTAMPEFKATDEKGRYLDWDKFRRIHPKESEKKWLAVKLNRQSLRNNLSLKHFNFAYCVPDSLQALLHFVDKTAGGNIGANSQTGLSRDEQDRFLLKSLIMEEAITSAQLEGAATTRKVAKEMLETARKPRTQDEMMIFNNYLLMKEAIKRKDEQLSIEMILDLHQTATLNAIENSAIAGEFRKDNEIFIADMDGNSLYQPPPYQDLEELMIAFCDFANADHSGEQGQFIHPVIKAMILHFLIGFIHPFGDGNGRTARALFYWYMLKSGYWLFEYISISRLLKEAPKQYAMAYIHTETDELDMTYFFYYQIGIIKRAITDLEYYISEKQKHFSAFLGEIAKLTAHSAITFNDRQIQILQKAVKNTGIIFTVKEISNQFSIAENTARADLKMLADLNLLGQLKSGNALAYIAPNDLLSRLQVLK